MTFPKFSAFLATVLCVQSALAGISYDEWAAAHHLTGAQAAPKANPDNDRFNNALEYTFGTDPLKADNPADVSPAVVVNGNTASFQYRIDKNSLAKVRVLQSSNLKNWTPVPGTPVVSDASPGQLLVSQPVSATKEVFYVLEAEVHSLVAGVTVVTVGTNVGQGYWEGLDPIAQVNILTEPPATSGNDTTPNTSKYPVIAGAGEGALTPQLKQEYGNSTTERAPLRSWLGWFLWGNGTPPDNINPGIFPTEAGYGNRTLTTNWDYFNFQWPAAEGSSGGNATWNPIRMDQQPLYLTPLTLTYNWAPGMFGYQSQPLKNFPNNMFYWKDKKIVRGVNFSGTIPFFYQYGDKVTSAAIPADWRQAWLYLAMRPLETTVVVPGNLSPAQLLAQGKWNEQPDTSHDPFPYPVWDVSHPASDQTPFAIQADRIGDFDADLVWEATNTRAGAYYDQTRYQRSGFGEKGIGNYMKMTVAQGSPFVWFETNNSTFANFYNLIRTNIPGQIDNNTNTGATTLPDGPYDVPGVTGVKFILLYGDHVNPNQWHQEVGPWYANLGGGAEDNGLPGGFNPPDAQHNHTYTAIFYRDDAVKPVNVGTFGKNAGTDAQKNPYFYLEFKNSGKNWFVMGAVPEMRYYNSGVPDKDPGRKAMALAWAQEMGKYAFNFVTATKIDYSVTNMFQVTTTHGFTVQNPYVSAKAPNAAAMTVPGKTILALNPHQYQPITLGPDLTKANKPQVVWSPLQAGYGTDLTRLLAGPIATNIPNANKTDKDTPAHWDYWSLRGNLKSIVTSGFSTVYPFQNFLPVMPPPDYAQKIQQTGIAGVNITNAGTGYKEIKNDNLQVTITDLKGSGTGAQALAMVNKFTGEIQQVNVTSPGSGYSDTAGDTSGKIVSVTIPSPDASVIGGVTAEAYAQTGGGKLLAVFMTKPGAGYSSVIKVTQPEPNSIDAPIIVPNFDKNGNMLPGLANVVEGGAGFNFGITSNVTILGTGTGAVADVVQPGSILDISFPAGGPLGNGSYPCAATGEAPKLTVAVPPPDAKAGTPAQTAAVGLSFNPTGNGTVAFQSAVINQGKYDAKPLAYVPDDDGNKIELNVDFSPGIGTVNNLFQKDPVKITKVRDVEFVGNATTQAVAKIYPNYTVTSVSPTSPLVGGYNSSVQLGFLGGDYSDTPGVTIPEIKFTIPSNGLLQASDVKVNNPGAGLNYNIDFEIAGGRGFDAVLQPIINGAGNLIAVKVLRGGSNYLPQGKVYGWVTDPKITGTDFAQVAIKIDNGVVTGVDITKPGSGHSTSIAIALTSMPPPYGAPNPNPDTVNLDNPKGVPVRFTANVGNETVSSLTQQGLPAGKSQMRYFPGSEGKATAASVPAFIWWTSNTPFARVVGPAGGHLANPAPFENRVDQVLYSSVISQYTTLAGSNLQPYGGGYLGASAPDGYGLGGQLGGASKFLGDIFNMQQGLGNSPNLTASSYAVSAATTPVGSFAAPVFQEHSPFVTLNGALKSSVQGLQQAITKLFLNPPSQNNPPSNSTNTWQEEYFSLFDGAVGRLVINPTATQPAWGVNSSVKNPPAIENGSKKDLSAWQKGMLWSGFGVSDQWNDQHYFYGYYLSSAALAGIFDQSWVSPISSKPASLWADAGQMGTAIEQMMLTLAYDPDNKNLNSVLYKNASFKYQKFAFFDQWNGHPWATGAPPGSTSAALDIEKDPLGFWGSFGTLNNKYNGENENSAFEGVQAWSATVLWGAATDRKPVVDLGIYLYSTSLAAADAYFLDKNYNQASSPNNKYSWVPVTTVDSSKVKQNGGNSWPVNTSYSSGNPGAFYKAPAGFGDATGADASPGQSLLKKAENTLNNYFYAYPTGSKFIQAYPSTPWTMGMVRNTNYMKKWAGSMMQEKWRQARDSALYQPADWNAMALTSALAGVPYNPGDVPFPNMGSTPASPPVQAYPQRLWSSWVTANSAPGAHASLNPPFLATSVLTFMLSLERYGTPDWTYIARATNAAGKDDNSAVVFTAAFSKQTDSKSVETTFVAFNPGWTTRYVVFQRLNTDGSINTKPVIGTKPVTVGPKKMVTVTVTLPVK